MLLDEADPANHARLLAEEVVDVDLGAQPRQPDTSDGAQHQGRAEHETEAALRAVDHQLERAAPGEIRRRDGAAVERDPHQADRQEREAEDEGGRHAERRDQPKWMKLSAPLVAKEPKPAAVVVAAIRQEPPMSRDTASMAASRDPPGAASASSTSDA